MSAPLEFVASKGLDESAGDIADDESSKGTPLGNIELKIKKAKCIGF